MAKLSPYVFLQELDNNGDPLAGGKVYTYEAGTTTPKTTYTDSTEDTANANPVILDASGRADIWIGSGAYKFVLTDSLDNTIKTVDNITSGETSVVSYSITTTTSITELYANARIYANGSLTLSLLAVADAGDGFVFTVKNIGSSNITIDPDAAETIDGASTATLLPNETLEVACNGTTWYTNKSNLPTGDITYSGTNTYSGDNTHSGDNTFSGANTFSGINTFSAIVKLAKGSDVASANALTLGTDGNYFDITGTTAITSIGTLGIGTVVKLHFDGALTLTHHATDLILPGGANITTAAGDEAEFVEYASGDWRCTVYTKANGEAVVASALGDYFESSEISVATGDQTYSAAHGLSSTPTLIKTILVCKTAEQGYAIDDEVDISGLSFDGSSGRTHVSYANATNIVMRQDTDLALPSVSTGTPFVITYANWRVVLRGWV